MNAVLLRGEGLHDVVGEALAEDYQVQIVERATDPAAINAAIDQLRVHAVAAIAVGAAATALLGHTAVLRRLTAAVVFGASPPASPIPYDQLKLQLLIHRAEQGRAMSAAQLAELRTGANADNVLVFDWEYPTANDQFFVAPTGADRDQQMIAWDRTRDFLINAWPD